MTSLTQEQTNLFEKILSDPEYILTASETDTVFLQVRTLLNCRQLFVSKTLKTLPPLPFRVLYQALNNSALSSNAGIQLRGACLNTGLLKNLFDLLAVNLQRNEENICLLFDVLFGYMKPMGKNALHQKDVHQLPIGFATLLRSSYVLPSMCTYLSNDSVLDIMRHHKLYLIVLKLLQALTAATTVHLLVPESPQTVPSFVSLLAKQLKYMSEYAARLQASKMHMYTIVDRDLTELIAKIKETSQLVQKTTASFLSAPRVDHMAIYYGYRTENVPKSTLRTLEHRYIDVMKAFRFETVDMIVASKYGPGELKFGVSHLYASQVKIAGASVCVAHVKRLAQEWATLSHALPLSYASTVFVRADSSRLDIMKALIIGPPDTPYANGCFVFDLYFPPNYPQVPLQIKLATTGGKLVRFNPNLYKCGRVCLSILNTWNGRPEEMWNAQTSSVLQVLLSIQSLILVAEPFYNEPGYGQFHNDASSRIYNQVLYPSTVRWAMKDQLLNGCPLFQRVIKAHFWLKRTEICAQVEKWIASFDGQNCLQLRREYEALRVELMQMRKPEGIDE